MKIFPKTDLHSYICRLSEIGWGIFVFTLQNFSLIQIFLPKFVFFNEKSPSFTQRFGFSRKCL